jgi:transposase
LKASLALRFQKETAMADGGDGFEGRIAVVQRTRGYRKWPEEVKARIVAESFRAGVRVVDVARRHGVIAHQLSDWRRQARQGLLALPEDAAEGLEGTPPTTALQIPAHAAIAQGKPLCHCGTEHG